MAFAAGMLVALSWLLARLIWLPFFFGLFFFLVAGLLVGAFAFRLARPARPIPGSVILRWVILAGLLTIISTTYFEYQHFRKTALGDPPRFAEARNAVVAAGGSLRDLAGRAADAYSAALKQNSPPGGPIGYVRWTISSGSLAITVDGHTETVTSAHTGFLWPLRTAMGMLLVVAGLWAGLESLRSATPVDNILPPGAEYIEDDD